MAERRSLTGDAPAGAVTTETTAVVAEAGKPEAAVAPIAKAPAKKAAKKAPAKQSPASKAAAAAKAPAPPIDPAARAPGASKPATRGTDRDRAETGEQPGAAAKARLVVREDESPWTDEELRSVEGELRTELARIERDMNTLQTTIADVLRDSGDGAGDDQADSGSKAFEREQEMTLLANTRESLFQTQHALQRMANGTYGVCESCGNAVGKLRLQAFPRATLCVSCKQRQERR
jgi:DnaK suppressor protein